MSRKKRTPKSDIDAAPAEVDTEKEIAASGEAAIKAANNPDSVAVHSNLNPGSGGRYRVVDGVYVPIKGE